MQNFKQLKSLNTEKGIKYICLTVLFLVITLLAWQSDDAFHAYTMARNFADGNGFVYNIGERVSASTCPLHTIIVGIVYKLCGGMYLSSLLLCILYSMGAIAILFSVCKSKQSIILATILLVFCKSFISYTTSGMENSLLFLLFALYLRIYLTNDSFNAKQILLSSLVAGLILMTRMDNALLAFPLMLFILLKRQNMSLLRAVLYGCVGLLPFIAWEVFSLLYYGFPFPNTAYTKLGSGFPLSDYFTRGFNYFFVALFEDLVVLIFPVLFIVKAIISKSAKYLMPAVGIVWYYGYIMYIGGDFMFGRHFTVPFFITLFCLFTFDWDAVAGNIKKALFFCVALHFLVMNGAIYYTTIYGEPQKTIWTKMTGQIADERAAYFDYTALIYNIQRPSSTLPPHYTEIFNDKIFSGTEAKAVRDSGLKGDIIKWACGLAMFYYADGIYLNDAYALGDPLLARLPAVYIPDWRPGHLKRHIPKGYRESVQTGTNKIEDPNLAQYLDILWEITRSEDLFAKGRLEKIININLGKYDYLLDKYIAAYTATTTREEEIYLAHGDAYPWGYDYACALVKLDRKEEACAILEETIEKFPYYVSSYPLLISLYTESSNHSALYAVLEMMEKVYRQTPGPFIRRLSPQELNHYWGMLATLRRHIVESK
ncbi:hypothetical protein AGMMS4957_13980 [Bacteroidia bacterium]|nr:hypothetical protein AGMMS4957_13980 [Bacteroidia bacterium]